MKKNIIALFVVSLVACFSVYAQQEDNAFDYRRNSMYSILVLHEEQEHADKIADEFLNIPIQDKYNDSDLSIKIVRVDKKKDYSQQIEDFINDNYIGSRLVAHWFNRDILTGQCDMELIKARGLYDASAFDYELASNTIRGNAMLQDAGEDLIGNTYLLVNEVYYIDQHKRAQNVAAGVGIGLSILGGILEAATGVDGLTEIGTAVGTLAALTISSLEGFRVKIHTRLYQLDWNDEIANEFYALYYSSIPDEEKRIAFENNRHKFKMKYVGEVKSKGGSGLKFIGVKTPEELIRKACQRAIDDNIVDLQKKFEQFRVKTPITSISPTITAQIGMKEGVSSESRYEVLEVIDNNGSMEYKRVGVIKPVPTMIWDNRFMAMEEGAYGADFGATTFVVESGKNFYPGMLIREI